MIKSIDVQFRIIVPTDSEIDLYNETAVFNVSVVTFEEFLEKTGAEISYHRSTVFDNGSRHITLTLEMENDEFLYELNKTCEAM